MRIYVIFGSPGSGKSTLIRILKKKKYKIISLGETIRKEAQSASSYSVKLAEHLNKGILIPDFLAMTLIERELEVLSKTNHPIAIEGFPSTIIQYKLFIKFLAKKYLITQLTLIHLICPKKIALKRMIDRFICKKCFQPYPGKAEKCTVCSGELIQRVEDAHISAKRRLQTFEETTLPILSLASQLFPIIKVNTNQTMKVCTHVFDQLLKRIGNVE